MSNENVRVTLTGAAGLVFSCKGENLLLDPYYSRISQWQMLFKKVSADGHMLREKAGALSPITGMVFGHSHFDHAFDAPELSRYTQGKILGSQSLENLMNAFGITGRITVCRGGETENLSDGIRVTMVPSVHGLIVFGKVPYPGEIGKGLRPPLKASDYRVGRVFAPVIEMGGKTFLHAGSAGFIENELEGHRCDVVFLCVPGWKKAAGYPERILEITGAKTVVLFHHHDFFRPAEKGKPVKILPFSDVRGIIAKIRAFDHNVDVLQSQLYETLEI
jgi:L-ascorbate metabolism protein UlaG (beta-lactamase superfamily)